MTDYDLLWRVETPDGPQYVEAVSCEQAAQVVRTLNGINCDLEVFPENDPARTAIGQHRGRAFRSYVSPKTV